MLFLGGMIGWNAEQEFESDDFIEQAAQALRNIVEVLAEGGARAEHLVRLTWYVTDRDEYVARQKELGGVYREIIGKHFPAMALVQVVALVEPRAKVEIEATAVVPLMKLGPTAHVDTFARDHLPPFDEWPELLLDGFDYPEYLNAAVELTDRLVEQGFGDHTALIGNGRRRTYKELSDWTNRLAHALTEDYGVQPGHRVLIRSANNPAMVACWLAATKAGAVVVNTMPMLRAGELAQIVDKAEITLALCDTRLMDELVACAKESRVSHEGDRVRRHRQPRRRARPRRAQQARALRGGANRAGRRRAARLHVGHDGPTEGHDALPSRSADHRRRLCEGGARASPPTTCSSARRHSRSPSVSAGWRCSRFGSARPPRCSRTRHHPT